MLIPRSTIQRAFIQRGRLQRVGVQRVWLQRVFASFVALLCFTTEAAAEDWPLRGEAPPQRVARRGVVTRLNAAVTPLTNAVHPRLHSSAKGSISVGTVTGGYLVKPAELEIEGDHHRVLEGVRHRNTRFTTDELKAQVMCAAELVAKSHQGHLLHLGNFSRQSGGDILWSVSHNSGLDADIAFLARRPNGRVIFPYHLYHFGRDLLATDSDEPMVFDVAANWTLVKGLLTCKHAKLTKMFVARWLRKPMLDFARATKEPEEVLRLAAKMLRQPRRAAAHNDHLHIRIACPTDDDSEGCVSVGRAPHAAYGRAKAVRARLPKLRRALRHADPQRRVAAAKLLGLYEDTAATTALRALLVDPTPAVRMAAARSLRWIAPEQLPTWLMQRIHSEASRDVVSTFLDQLHHLEAIEALTQCLLDRRTLEGEVPLVVRERAARLLATSRSRAAATQLVMLLHDELPRVRHVARTALERITNHSEIDLVLAGTLPGLSGPPSDAEAADLWHRFLAMLPPGLSHQDLMLRGFALRGLVMEQPSKQHLTSLAIALGWPSPYRDNAHELLTRVLHYEPEQGRGNRVDAARFWRPWLSRRRKVRRRIMWRAARQQREPPLGPEVRPGFARVDWAP